MRNIDFEIGAELVLGPLLIAFCVLTAFRALRRHPGWTGGHAFTRLAAAFYAAAVLDLTIFPIHVTYGEYANQTPWYDLVNFIPLLVADLTFVPNLLMLVPLGFFRMWSERSRFWQVMAVIATICAIGGVTMTFSRGAAVGFALVIVIMTFMRYIKIWQLGIIVLAISILFTLVPEYSHRLLSLQGATSLFATEGTGAGEEQADGSMRSRLTEGLAAILVFVDHPLVGVGPGMFRYYYQEYASYVGIRVLTADRQAHSLFPGLMAENGGLGLLFFCLILFVTLRDLHRVRKRWVKKDPDLANMATGFFLAVITYLTTGIFLHFAFIRYFWLIMALASAAAYVAKQEELKEAQLQAEASEADALLPGAQPQAQLS